MESKINKLKHAEYRNFSVILFQDCVVKWEFKARNLVRRTNPHPQSLLLLLSSLLLLLLLLLTLFNVEIKIPPIIQKIAN